jgi:HAD superfamily hydrolase (TIGR01509 family)
VLSQNIVIKAIIFDLWETLGTKNVGISKTLKDKFKIEQTLDFLERYECSIQLKEYKNQEDLALSFLNYFNIEINQENIDFVVNTLESGINKAKLFDGMYDLIKHLSKSYSLGILSNTTCFESQVISNWKIGQYFDAQVYSWQLGSLKPSVSNFKDICAKLNVSPEEAIFIDDGEKNIIAAQNLGFKTIQYKEINQLKKELVSYSVKLD